MSDTTKIEWADYTFNPWTGCTAVSPACDHCYAEGWSKRSGHVQWGPHGDRRRTKTWGNPVKWNRQAEAEGVRYRVFCASLADVADNHKSIQQSWRDDLKRLIDETPHLDWLLLTKRPQNFMRFYQWRNRPIPRNVWVGTTVENQEEADRRIPKLLEIPARVRFLSCEPLLEPVDLTPYLWGRSEPCQGCPRDADCECGAYPRHMLGEEADIAWVICGGESGHGARPLHPKWARGLRDQCISAGVPFFFKQWGEWIPAGRHLEEDRPEFLRPKRGDRAYVFDDHQQMGRVGKRAAGRLLDEREWNEAPA